jgi:RimJ/RimL family protein N-acetyltransferase
MGERADRGSPTPSVRLRDVREADLPIFFEYQDDPTASRMAAVPTRERDAFMEHWATTVLVNDTGHVQTIVTDGRIVGYILSFERSGEVLVGYWIGRDDWGKGIASRALELFLTDVERRRPLHAQAAKHNVGSLRVLEKCGFVVTGVETVEEDGVRLEEVSLRLDAT